MHAQANTEQSRTVPIPSMPQEARADVFEPANNLDKLSEAHLLFCGSSLIFLTCFWLGATAALYVVTSAVYPTNLYEARWYYFPVVAAGACAVALHIFRCETFFLACAISCIASVPCCLTLLIGYGANIAEAHLWNHRDETVIDTTRTQSTSVQYVCAAATIIVPTSFALATVCWLVYKLYCVARWHYKNEVLNHRDAKLLVVASVVLVCVAGLSILVVAQIMTLRLSQVHSYTLAELFCNFMLVVLAITLSVAALCPNRLIMKTLLYLLISQFTNEIFFTWRTYFMALFIGTHRIRVMEQAGFNHMIMPLNFISHFIRLCLVGYLVLRMLHWLQVPMVQFRGRIDRRVFAFMRIGAALCLSLGMSYVIVDIMYTTLSSFYRTMIAFTGVGVFYATVAGVCLSLFARKKLTLLLVVALVALFLLCINSAHTVYIYLGSAFYPSYLDDLTISNRTVRSSALLHFGETLIALCSALVSAVYIFALVRFLRLDSEHTCDTPAFRIGRRALFLQGAAILATVAVDAAALASIRDRWHVFDTAVAYGVNDIIVTLMLGVFQCYVALPSNCHVRHHLTAIMFFHLVELIFTFNKLHTQTFYVQVLLIFNHLVTGASAPTRTVSYNSRTVDNSVAPFTNRHIAPMLVSHAVELIQLILCTISLITSGVCLELSHKAAPVTVITVSAISVSNPMSIPTAESTDDGHTANEPRILVAYENPGMTLTE